jgi:hypothetical protein
MRSLVALFLAGCWTNTPAAAPPQPDRAAEPTPAAPAVERFGRRTPREALRSFVRAIDAQRYDVVLKFVPRKYRDHLTVEKVRDQFEGAQREQNQQIVDRIRAHLDAQIDERDDIATLAYDGRFQVKLVREDGVWCVQDLD